MFSMAFTEDLFNSAAAAFFNAETLQTSPQKAKGPQKAFFKTRQLFMQPWKLNHSVYKTYRITEAPVMNISESGLTVHVRGKLEASSTPQKPDPRDFSVSVICQTTMTIQIENNRLTSSSDKIRCRPVTSNKIKDALAKLVDITLSGFVQRFLNDWMSVGIPIPLPEGMNLTNAKISYRDHSVIVEGNLEYTAHGLRTLVKKVQSR